MTHTFIKKRFISMLFASVVLLTVLLPSLCACDGGGILSDETTLYVYNWGEYISDGSEDTVDVNEEFERWYYDTYGERVKVNYSTYSSNESMYAKISSGSTNYDVIVPSDYMIQRMIDEGLLAKLNYENIPNAESILPEFENADYDPDGDGDGYNDYSVPYMYGMIGIIYNTTMVDEADIGSWDLMWNEKYAGNILQFNNSRDAFGSAQYFLGLDVNSDNEAEWRRALLSRNIAARRRENDRYLRIKRRLFGRKLKVKLPPDTSDHVFRACTHCHATLRLPREQGKHTVKCPRCQKRFRVRVK